MTAAADVATGLLSIALEDLHESPHNPRKHFDSVKLAELAESLKKGQLAPVLVRERNTAGGPGVDYEIIDGYELAAGHRRFRAAQLAGLTHLLAIVRPMTDAEFLEIVTIENLQREDVSALEEAAGFKALQDQSRYDVPTIAEKIGKSKEYVYGRLKLLELAPEAQKQMAAGTLTAGHAILLARLAPDDQATTLKQMKQYGERGPSVRELNGLIDEQVRARGAQERIDAAIEKLTASGGVPLRISSSWNTAAGILANNQWVESKKSAKGAVQAVVVEAWNKSELGKVLWVQVVKPEAAAVSHVPETREERETRQARDERDRQKREVDAVVELTCKLAVVRAVKWPPPRGVAEAIASRLLEDSGFADDSDAVYQLIGLKVPEGESPSDARLSAAIRKATDLQLSQAISWSLLDSHGWGDDVTVPSLAKTLGIDLKAVKAKAIAEAKAGAAAVQSSAKPAKKRAGDVAKKRSKGAR